MATVESIFADLSQRLITGLMVHEQFESYYSFLNLPKYAECHRERYKDESELYFKLKCYYMDAHDRLIKDQAINNPHMIPNNWFNYKQDEVDTNTKRNAVRDGLLNWISWETDTKHIYERAYKDLLDLNEVADALFVKKMIKSVNHELAEIKKWYMIKKDCDFNITIIIADQK